MDEIEEFFATITPEDFIRETSAYTVEEVRDPVDHDEFRDFVEGSLKLTKRLFNHQGITMSPVAVLQSKDERRQFRPDADETIGMFYSRLEREAAEFDAVWFFTSLVSQAAVGETHDVSTEEGYEKAVSSEKLVDAINWYAESTAPSCKEAMFGVVTMEEGTASEIQFGRRIEGAASVFREVLRGTM